MKHNSVSIAAAIFLAGSNMCASGARAEPLAGSWEWVSVEATMANGSTTLPFGPKPQGLVIFESNGRFSWLIAKPGRPNFAAGRRDQGTSDENQAAVHGSLAYSGVYSIDGDQLIFKIDASTYPNEEGKEQKRVFTLNRNELRWANPMTSGGTPATAVLKRVN